jgi:hypothetical protein
MTDFLFRPAANDEDVDHDIDEEWIWDSIVKVWARPPSN